MNENYIPGHESQVHFSYSNNKVKMRDLYHICFDKKIVLGRCAIKRVPCYFQSYCDS